MLSHEKYLDFLNKAGQHLKILPHSVINSKEEVVELCSSVECKGIIGNDGRHYILDLLRTFPPDVNFLKVEELELSNEVKEKGFPIEHKHKLSCLRQELLEAFVEDRYVMFIKYAAFHLQQLNNAKKMEQTKELREIKDFDNTDAKEEDKIDTEEAKKIYESSMADDKQQTAIDSKNVVKKACAAVGSLKENEFEIRFNPDVFSGGIRHVDSENECCSLKNQKKLVKEAAEFLLLRQIPNFVNDCLDHSSAPMDGLTLTEQLHNRGINIRYLGKVAENLANVPQLEYLYSISVSELILRSAKHIFNNYIQSTDMMSISVAISHFLNCLLTTQPIIQAPQVASDELFRTSKRRYNHKRSHKSNNHNSSNSEVNTEWTQLTQKNLWQQIKKELKSYWDFELSCECNVDKVVEHYKLQKISLLRAFNLKVGLQILLREYNFESKNKPTFNEDDIVNVFPICKHINPRASDAYNFYTTGQNKIQQGFFKDGYELISEALNLLNNVYGAMHSENAQCLRMLARLSYIMGDPQEALAIQQRAVLMSERVNGVDHPYTITEYSHLALYCFANSQISTALKLLYRARYLATIVCGENHPDIALMDVSTNLKSSRNFFLQILYF